jgi:hypothetical protein
MAVVLAVVLGACGDGTAPDPSLAVVGTYAAEGPYGAIVFTTEQGGEQIDWLARGASVRLELRSDGATAGRLFAPGADEDGGDFDEDLSGTWSLVGSLVRLEHEADTFLRDIGLVATDGRLKGEYVGGDMKVLIELARQ